MPGGLTRSQSWCTQCTDPLYVAAKTAALQLIWGISSTVASAILHAWGIKNLDTASPWDAQNIT
jgi:hypothetical protein